MSLRHSVSLAIVGTVCFACTVPVPVPPKLIIAIDGKARAPVPPAPEVKVQVEVGVEASAEPPQVEVVVPPPQPTVPVALHGAAVVEFFGIPLEGTQDVVFVLDRSGSMDDYALGQIAQLVMAPEPAPVEAPAALIPTEAASSELPPAAEVAPEPPLANDSPVSPEVDPSQELAPPEAAPSPPRPRKIDVAQAELAAALERLPAGTRMNVLFFNNRLEAHQAKITPLQEGDREGVIGFVRQTVPYGTTALAPAMRTAYLMNARRIVLLSDGLGNVGGDAAAVLRDAREAMRGGVRIDTIGLGQDQDVWLLERLASESSGIYQQL